jgi:type VI secretion system protein ImpF
VPPFEARTMPSLLERLTDHSPDSREENPLSRLQEVRVLKASLWRDLNALLNTRRKEEEIPEEFTEANRSLLTFGLPDFTSYSLKSPLDQNRLRRALEAAIRRFEPRLEKVTVTLESTGETDPGLRFRVDALLRVEPVPEPISFETLLQPGSGRFVVAGGTS